ncbi:MAG TPA: hypothetical protein VJX16_22020 [Terriglobales bacterium]|nr:hypothetical protein [Terriglobales bacterium]
MSVLMQNPDRDATVTQTAHDPEAAVVSSHDYRANSLVFNDQTQLPTPFSLVL